LWLQPLDAMKSVPLLDRTFTAALSK
jgi:hypothetical protein